MPKQLILLAIVKPHWDNQLRRLYLGQDLLKWFRRPAPIAELIFATFEEEDWKSRIDDPLTPLASNHEPSRLRNEIQSINRRLSNRLIHFFMDGTGEGICWERIAGACKATSR